MKISNISPSITRVSNILTLAEVDFILSAKGFPAMPSDKYDVLMKIFSGIVYNVTGQLYEEKTLKILYSSNVGDKKLDFPYRAKTITSIKVDGVSKSLDDFVYNDNELIYTESYFPQGEYNIEIDGVFGYSVDERPNDIDTAVYYLLEDYNFGDRTDRMMSQAMELKLDVLNIDTGTVGGFISGNKDVDRILSRHKWENSPVFNPAFNQSGDYSVMTVL